MQSIWSKQVHLPEREPLSGDLSVDVAILGGGMAGILTAYLLGQRGIQAVVLEAERMAGGQTQNTTAKITSQHGRLYHRLIGDFGVEKAQQYANANQRAIDKYEQIVQEEQIDCGFERLPAYLYTLEDPLRLQLEARAAARLGIPALFTTETTLPFAVSGAVKFERQAQFHPLAFLRGLADKVQVYEHTRAQAVEETRVVTNRGVVQANWIVFATHYPFVNAPGYYFMRMYQQRSYVVSLENAAQLDGMYLGIDPQAGWSFRNAGDLLLLGGEGHRTGENRLGGRYEALARQGRGWWPNCRETARWSAQDCMTLDDVPYIGTFSTSTPHWLVATGFKKWGMTSSMAAAQLLSAQIAGKLDPNAEVFSPARFTPSASAEEFLKNSVEAVRGLSRRIFAPSRTELDALPAGHGGIVDCDGYKAGVYKEPGGKTHIVSIRCPHLGCQLEWNPDEKSWDCPCHGSRFDCDGQLICGPAQTGIQPKQQD